MRTILLTVSLIASLFTNAQNGGQSNESNSLKLEQIGYANGKAIIRITNKQACSSNVEVKFNGNTSVDQVNGNSMDTILILVAIGTKVKAKPLTGCGSFDNGNIELSITAPTLPVKFLSYGATANDKTVVLQWITEEEQVSHYIIQESGNGIEWNNTGVVFAASGTYSFTDNTGSSYYRIVSVDIDGKVQYSGVMRVQIQSKEQLAVYPNPVVGAATVSLKGANTAKISLYNLSGVLVKQVDTKGQQVVQIDFTGMNSGVYYVTDGLASIKINKQ
jgi:hypothetical protein